MLHTIAPPAMLVRAIASLLLLACLNAVAAPAPVTLLTVDGAIGPASADYVSRGIARAQRDGSQLVLLQLDTPGGLDQSMRTVIKAMLASSVPVAVYVAPSGARAASAGTFILYASHIAAMAPGTNLGAASPVQIGAGPDPPSGPAKDKPGGPDPSPSARKATNDAAAYIRGLAQLRGRNGDWAERAVREAVSLPAGEALRIGVIDYIGADVPALLRVLDGKRVAVLEREVTLATAGAALNNAQPDWRVRLLGAISDPGLALILLTIGIYGLLFEFMSPGAVAPGVIGALCLLLGLYGLHLLPLNYAGLGLILLGLAFMLAEAFLPSFGVLGLGGIVAFVTGALILIDTDLPDYGIPVGMVVVLALLSALLTAATAALALKTRRRAPRTGPNTLIGSQAEVLDAVQREGWASVHGETWRIVSGEPLRRGQIVRVLRRRGAVLEVTACDPLDNHNNHVEQGE